MKYINYIIFVLLIWGCTTKEDVSPEVVKPLVGTWRVAAYEKTVNDEMEWVELPIENTYKLQFREDGVVLDEAGLPICCGPSALRINGTLFQIKPATSLPDNPTCQLVNCAICEVWDITLNQGGQEFIFECPSLGSSHKTRYVRSN
ncbi:hypothetical protein [Telluribacter humicola]|uniref:hypothetical protein n=1 Tax=Telluribacter humicola TaxID=1720261 RepID=UPI001A96782A|nr:hypothetical protein [Telluribacter humicola]